MPNYQAKNELVLNRQLKVERLVVPFLIVGSATSANVAITCDEGGFVFFRSQGNDQITPALDAGETATYTASPNDSTGVVNILVKLRQDVPVKIMKANAKNRITGVDYQVYLGSASGLAVGANDLMLSATIAAFNSATTLDACLEVEYTVQE